MTDRLKQHEPADPAEPIIGTPGPPPSKVVFLDIDGVLNDAMFLDKRDVSGPRVWHGTWADMINPEAVARLNRILDATGAVVVVSSSWRIAKTIREIDGILRAHGFTGIIVGRTASLGARFMEIRMYAANAKLDCWIALDDGNMPELGERMVLTSWARGGLLDEHVTQAIEKLGGDLEHWKLIASGGAYPGKTPVQP